jgi:3-methyladenine DNA glycosylase Tag
LRVRRKYAATLLQNTPENQKLLKSVRNFVAYGTIDEKALKELIEKRGQALPGKKISEDAAKEIEKKGFEGVGLKGFFRLHPARGGIDSKLHFGVSKKAVLGDHGEKIGELVGRML